MKKNRNTASEKITTDQMGMYIQSLYTYAQGMRRSFERRWYDNNFFDDGFHYRFLQKTTNKIIDLSDRSTTNSPMRAIPKASKQIRGVANLLVSNDPTPIIFPEDIRRPDGFSDEEFEEAKKYVHDIAKKRGQWMSREFEDQELTEKIAFMVILAAKHGVSFMQVWPDAVAGAIKTRVYDAFDIILDGAVNDIEDSPFIGKGVRRLISEIKADERFDREQVGLISPDNKFASSEIKEAYMAARFGRETHPDAAATLIQKETYLKEYLGGENMQRIRMQDDGDKILKGKKDGDPVIRQVFSAGNVWLRDRYVNLNKYPFIDFRFEPGPIYQTPLIERFIPANKSLDAAVSRIERFLHTMNIGLWLKRSGEQFNITNQAGAQLVEYEGAPPQQMPMVSIPAYVFNFVNELNSQIEEQGVSTSTLAQLPSGVKAAKAIEALKESEYASLVIANRRLKRAVQTIAERMLEIADEYIIKPKRVQVLDDGMPESFDVIGASALSGRKKLGVDTPSDVVSLKKGLGVKVEIQSGAAFTREGRRDVARQIVDVLAQYYQLGIIPPEAVKVAFESWLKDYQFGPVNEFMEEWTKAQKEGSLTSTNMEQIKVAVMEVMNDLIKGGVLPNAQQRIDEGKVATVESIVDMQKGGQDAIA